MSNPKFSIVIPVYSELTPKLEGNAGHLHYRAEMVKRAVRSVRGQQFPNWELILVNDGSQDPSIAPILQSFADKDERIKVVTQENLNRAYARNNGMEHATGEWICWMDCDDEYVSHYLRELDMATKDFPEYDIFNFGAIVFWPDHRTTIRDTFYPKIEGKGHEWFRSGHIGCGSFIFKRELWASDPKYRIPNEVNPYEFAAASKFDLRLDPIADEFQFNNAENPTGAFSDGVYRHGLSLGNPWGDDFLQFYLLTRDNLSKPLDVYLYIQYPRGVEDSAYEYYGGFDD